MALTNAQARCATSFEMLDLPAPEGPSIAMIMHITP